MVSYISRGLHRSQGVLASLVGITAVCVALSARADYDATSSDIDVKDSCKDFSVDGDGVLTAPCNDWGSNHIVDGTSERDIDLDDKIGFDGSELKFNLADFSDKCVSETVSFGSDKLTLKAECSETAEATGGGKTVSIRIDWLLFNDPTGLLAGSILGAGLNWRQSPWSD